MDRVRIDKWLWAARFFKSRALASHACELGRIDCNGQSVKASREVRAGDRLRVKNDSGDFQSRCWPPAKCAARRQLPRRSIARRKPAGSSA